ncbi:c-type cytochrome [candidate division KSB1 bacterium]|nr:c-type cytochrome [candidate division KSB1 bacterium]
MRFLSRVVSLIALSSVLLIGCAEDSEDTSSSPYDLANGGTGGVSYDKFWSRESGHDTTDTHLATFNTYSDFFRCKQCHGWDLLGQSGSYIGRGPRTTRPNVSAVNLRTIAAAKTSQELFDALKTGTGATRRPVSADLSTYDPATNPTVGDQMPNLAEILTDGEIWNLVKYLKEEAIDVSQLYDATYTGAYPTGSATYSNIGRNGNATSGASYFAAHCAVCHGSTGQFIEVEEYLTVGAFLRHKPNEVQHKVKFGQLGSDPNMAGQFGIQDEEMINLYKALTDTIAFP